MPFTPVPGPRLFVRPGPYADGVRDALIDMLAKIAGDNSISSVHATFCTEADWKRFGEHGWLLRLGQQYHWHNDGYRSFDDFLAALSSRKRKAIRKEREAVRREGLTIRRAVRRRHQARALGRLLRLLHGHRRPQMGHALSDARPSSTSWAAPWPTRSCW